MNKLLVIPVNTTFKVCLAVDTVLSVVGLVTVVQLLWSLFPG